LGHPKRHREHSVPLSAQRKVEVEKRRTKAVKLAAKGRDYAEIAAELGYHDRSGAYKAVAAALRAEQAEGVDLLRQLETMRLDALQESLWDAATSGDAKAVDQVVRIIMTRVRLLGLDQREDKARGGCRPVVSTAWRG
jgi:hypothetical protein